MMSISKALGLSTQTLVGMTSSSQFESEGGLPTFDGIPFRVHAGQYPSLNTFVVVIDAKDRCAHYGRIVVGSEMNLRAHPGDLQRSEAYNMPRRDIRLSDQSPDVVRTMRIETLGEISLLKDGTLEILEAASLPQTGQQVHLLPTEIIPELLNTPKNGADGLYLGDVESGANRIPFYLPHAAIARHMAILGKTGVGKSYAAGVLIEELSQKNIPIITFDVLGDTRSTAQDLNGKNYVAGEGDIKIPFSIIGLQEFISFIPSLTSDQGEIVSSAYGDIFDRALISLDRGQIPNISFNELYEKIDAIGTAIGSKATANARRRTENALKYSTILTDKVSDWFLTLSEARFTNIYIGHMGQFQRNLLIGASARILQRLRRLNRIPPFVLVLDEAHLFLPSGEGTASTRVLREMIRTARHDAIGIVLISQSPSSFDKQILMTCNTRLIFALDPDDLRVVSGQIGDLPQVALDRIPRMGRGRAVLSSGMDIMRHPVTIKIRERVFTSHAAETPDMVQAVEQWYVENS